VSTHIINNIFEISLFILSHHEDTAKVNQHTPTPFFKFLILPIISNQDEGHFYGSAPFALQRRFC